jgi:hypothetical protein
MTDIMTRAALALAALDRAEVARRMAQAEVDAVCREYGDAMRVWGIGPHHLRQAVEARAGKKQAA